MTILICGERFLTRFGADRVLLLFGRRLKALGHRVVLVGFRFDDDSRAIFGPDIVSIPGESARYIELDAHTSTWLRDHWEALFSADPPGLALVGGWPFYEALPFLRGRCPVVAMDFGAVPLDGLWGAALAIQQRLRGLRDRYLESASLIVANSRFTAETQSAPDSHGKVAIAPLLVGADHIEEALWERRDGSAADVPAALAAIADLHSADKRAVLALGRWEPVGYKNSEAALDLLRALRSRLPGTALFVLASGADVAVPDDLEGAVVPLGFPGDRELGQLMAAVDLGVSVSRWEGFNLPLAEMQWLGRPVLAFDLGAHPEVIADSWYLCRDLSEMADKAEQILTSTANAAPVLPADALLRFRRHFRWERAFRELLGLLIPLTSARDLLGHLRAIIDVTDATRDPANSGVIRVTRRLGEALQRIGRPVFVVWDEPSNRYVFPTADEFAQLGRFSGPVATDDLPRSPASRRLALDDRLGELRRSGPCCLLLTETVPAARVAAARGFCSARGIPLAAIFYDAIAVLYPELCPDPLIRDNHGAYMRQLAECDLVLPISQFSARCLQEHWDGLALSGREPLPLLLPGELDRRADHVDDREAPCAHIVCVSTLEPRKNHRALLAACQLLDERFPGLSWSLTLVGNRYAGAFDIAEMVEEARRRDRRIEWRGIVDDHALAALYRSAAFTVYPSLVEGFGMPVMESLWSGTPCICRNEGVMAELAAGGGCLAVDVTDPVALCDAMGRLATDRALRARLAAEAVRRPIATWRDYAADVAAALAADCAQAAVAPGRSAPAAIGSHPDWTEVLYPGCLLTHWQQDNSERLAIAAVLSRQRPRCSLEIGTYRGGSLSLIRQYSELVFSIDVDAEVAERFRDFSNVSFLTGPSPVVLPVLFRELDNAGIPVEFILVDGDHTEAGVARDIGCILDYVPKTPLFIMLHDSFNPDCRRGMLTAPWQNSRYVRWVDVDFVPGRLVETGGPFDRQLWGGLAMAYLTPAPRAGDLVVRASAGAMFDELCSLQHRPR
jgi:glycosyltransferase involved in cell wall biosynthesis